MRSKKKILSILIFGMFTINILGLSNFNTLQVKAATIPTLKILEVQPGSKYDLSLSNFTGKANVVQLDQMPMSEFIGKIDQINGEYDIVYIGNNTTGGSTYSAVGALATTSNTKSGSLISNINKTGWQETFSENDITYKRAGNPILYGIAYDPDRLDKDKKYLEASGLRNFADSGQLLVFDNAILSSSSTLKSTKLYTNFIGYKGLNNLYEVPVDRTKNITTDSYINATNIINRYNACNPRPSISIEPNGQPAPYRSQADLIWQNDTNGNPDPRYKNLTFKFKMKSNSNVLSPVIARLYLDINGDGLFKADEKVKEITAISDGNQAFTLNFNSLPQGFSGILQWKIEVVDTVTKAKNYISDYVAYAGNPQPIRVLQIISGANRFSLNKKSDFGDNYKKTGFYEFSITEVAADAFSNSYVNKTYLAAGTKTYYDNGTLKERGSFSNINTKLKGNYDMIVIGFADSYGGGSLPNDITSQDARNAIKEFIAAGQSVMFTHDTMSRAKDVFNGSWTDNLQRDFKDIVGQSRYIDVDNPTETNPDGTKIPHDAYPVDGKKALGYTPASLKNFNTIGSTYKLNDGLMTNFPNTLGSNIGISQTHDQWIQLNLEDEDVVPWYTLNYGSTDNRKSDVRNYYYTYSKGNITFSGTGHSSPASSISEKNLFINTIYKASRGANHAPTVQINLSNDGNVSKNQDKFDFSFLPFDQDGGELKYQVFINGTDITNKLENSADNTLASGKVNSNELTSLRINKADLSSAVGSVNPFILKVKIIDNMTAFGESQVSLNYVQIPTVSLTSDIKAGYLVNDNPEITLKLNANDSNKGTDGLLNFQGTNPLFLNTSDNTAVSIANTDYWTNIRNIKYTDGAADENKEQTNKVKLNLLKPNDTGKSYIVNTKLQYKFDSDPNIYDVNYPMNFSVQEGTIEIKVLDQSNNIFKPSYINIKKPDGSTLSYYPKTDGTEVIMLHNQPSGNYIISIPDVDGEYLCSGSSTNTISLSYAKPQQSISFNMVKLQPPTINASNTNWTKDNVTFTLIEPNNFDATTLKMQYKIDNGSWTDYKNSSVAITTNGVHSIFARTINNIGVSSSEGSLGVKIDKAPPTKPNIILSNSKITNTNVSYTVTPGTDADSGILRTEYQIDGDSGIWQVYLAQGTIVSEGTHRIYARSIDMTGNISSNALATLIIDKTPPETPNLSIQKVSGGVKVTLSFSETGGTKEIFYNNGWYPYTEPVIITKSQTVKGRQTDEAGNISSIFSQFIPVRQLN